MKPGHGRVLEDAHPALKQNPAQLTGKPGRLYGGDVAAQHPAAGPRHIGDAPHGVTIQDAQLVTETVSGEQVDGRLVGLRLPFRRTHEHHTVLMEGDVGAVPEGPVAHLARLCGKGGEIADPLILAQRGTQSADVGPAGIQKTSIGTAAAGAADIGLQDHDAQRRSALAQLICRPQAGEAAPHDAHVGRDVRVQGRTRCAGIAAQGLFEPVTPRLEAIDKLSATLTDHATFPPLDMASRRRPPGQDSTAHADPTTVDRFAAQVRRHGSGPMVSEIAVPGKAARRLSQAANQSTAGSTSNP